MAVTIVGLGAGDIHHLTLGAWRALETATTVILRTTRHPCVPDLPPQPRYLSCDDLYETYDDFGDVYAAIVARVLDAATSGDVVYAVPGDPFMGEAAVLRLREACAAQGIALHVLHGVSFVEPTLGLLGVDGMNGLQVFDALDIARLHHPPLNPTLPALIAQVYSRAVASDVKLTLMNEYDDNFGVALVHGAGTASAHVERLPLYEIDRSPHIQHMTALYVPPLGAHTSFESFQETIAHLRAPEGCPWDRKQTHASLRRYLVEETYEVLDAIDAEDWDALADELGDILLQVTLHTQIAVDDGEFFMHDVLARVNNKLIRRHPHVWGQVDVNGNTDTVLQNWEQIKQGERAEKGIVRASLLDGVPKAMPALQTTLEYTRLAAKVGFDWQSVVGVADKVREELAEVLAATDDAHKIREIGDLISTLVNWWRWLGVTDAEGELRKINAKFYRRFRYIEQTAAAQGRELAQMTLAEMDALWDEAKRAGL